MYMFALTELGFPGQTIGHKMTLTETKRNHTAVVIEPKPHLAQKTRCHRDEGDQEKWTLRKSLLRTTLRSNWTIGP